MDGTSRDESSDSVALNVRTKETPGRRFVKRKVYFCMKTLNSNLGPIRENDAILDKKALDEKIQQSIKDYENGNVFRMKEEESVSDFVNRLNSSNLRQR